MRGIPGHDLGRDEADQADADCAGFTSAVGQFLFDDHIGFKQRVVIGNVVGQSLAAHDIGEDDGKLRTGNGGF